MHIPTYPRACALVFMAALAAAAQGADDRSVALVRQGLQAQGGEALLRGVSAVSFDARGYRNMLEQSERPEGPWLVEFMSVRETHDQRHQAMQRKQETWMPPSVTMTQEVAVRDGIAMRAGGGKTMPGRASDVQEAKVALALSPEHVLLTALAAPDLHMEADVELHSMPQHTVGFTLEGAPVKLYLSAATGLPTAVDVSGALVPRGYASFLGDVVQQTHYSFWRRDASGLRYPMQWDVQLNGMPDRVYMLEHLRVRSDGEAGVPAIPDAVAHDYRKAAAQSGQSAAPVPAPRAPVTLAPGVVMLAGSWYTAIVEQEDGLVILEAPISSDYSAKVLEQAAQLFPGRTVKAVVTTSDAWPHLAGIREYVARGIPVYALDRNEPILRRTIAAPYASKPDALQRQPRQATMTLVSQKTVIGSGANRIELYPLRGASLERQMMAYLPGHRLLYGSDAFQMDGKQFFLPQVVDELVQAVDRERLDVDRVFLMHVPAIPFADLRKVPGSAD